MGNSLPRGMFDDKLQELMDLLDEQGDNTAEEPVAEEPVKLKSKDEMISELMAEEKDEVLAGDQAAMYEYSMMMKQWEALMEDYERQEAEEKAASQAAEGSVE